MLSSPSKPTPPVTEERIAGSFTRAEFVETKFNLCIASQRYPQENCKQELTLDSRHFIDACCFYTSFTKSEIALRNFREASIKTFFQMIDGPNVLLIRGSRRQTVDEKMTDGKLKL